MSYTNPLFLKLLERLCSAGLLPRVSSAASIDLPSDESAESIGRLQMRTIPSSDLHPHHHHLAHHNYPQHHQHDGSSAGLPSTAMLTPASMSLLEHPSHLNQSQQQHHHHHHQHHHHPHHQQQHSIYNHHQASATTPHGNDQRQKSDSSRRLSIRHDQLSIDSIC